MGTSYILKQEKCVQNFYWKPEETRRIWGIGGDRKKLTWFLKKKPNVKMWVWVIIQYSWWLIWTLFWKIGYCKSKLF